MSMDWLKLYHEARRDAKLATLTDAQHRCWFCLLLLASEQIEDRGTIPFIRDRLLALEVSAGKVDVLHETITALADLEIVVVKEDGSITFLAFARRNARKPSDEAPAAAERKRNQRERDAAASAIVTPMSRAVTRSHALDKSKTREDQESVHDLPSPGGDDDRTEEIPFADGPVGPEETEDPEIDQAPSRPRPAPKPRETYSTAFEAWWALYPRKVAKLEAWKAWKRIEAGGVSPADLTDGLTRWTLSADWAKADPQYLPHPATWLNGRRFEDHPEPAVKTNIVPIASAASSRESFLAWAHNLLQPLQASEEKVGAFVDRAKAVSGVDVDRAAALASLAQNGTDEALIWIQRQIAATKKAAAEAQMRESSHA